MESATPASSAVRQVRPLGLFESGCDNARALRPVHRLAIVLATLQSACSPAPDPLLGEWVSAAPTSPSISCQIGSDGRMLWTIDFPGGAESFELSYRVDRSTQPMRLDIDSWPTGSLAGRTLLGIVEIESPDRFRVDFEPGDPGGDESERPAAFSAQTLTFLRRVN